MEAAAEAGESAETEAEEMAADGAEGAEEPTAAPAQESTDGVAKEPMSPGFDLVSFAKDSERSAAAAKVQAVVRGNSIRQGDSSLNLTRPVKI